MKAIHGMNLRNFLYIKGKEQEDSASPSSEEDLIHIHSPVSAPSATTPWSEICNLSHFTLFSQVQKSPKKEKNPSNTD